MKNLLFPGLWSVIFSLICFSGNAQVVLPSQDSLQYMVDSRPDSMRHGFFHALKFNSTFHVQFEGDMTYIFQKPAALTGFQVAWVINHKLAIGAKFDVLTSQVKVNKYINSIDTVYSGATKVPNLLYPLNMSAVATIGYIFRSGKKISIQPDLGLGWAYMSVNDPAIGWIDPTQAKVTTYTANYFTVNPTLSVIWNVSKYARIGAVVGAKGVFGKDYLRLKSYRVGGPYIGLFLRFGTF